MYRVVQHVDIDLHSTADAAKLYELVRNGATWPSWSPIDTFELEQPGTGEPEGIGAIRIFTVKAGPRTYRSRERIVELVPDRRLSYALVSGLAVRDYRAYIDLEPDATGTRVHWYSSFEPKVPGTGRLYRAMLTKTIGTYARGLVAYAERT